MSETNQEKGKKLDGRPTEGCHKSVDKEDHGKVTPQRSGKRGRLETSPPTNISLDDSGNAKEQETRTPKNVSILSYLWDEEEKRSIKKLKEDSAGTPGGGRRASISSTRKMSDKITRLIKSMDKDLRETRRLVVENPNTKKEIKTLIKSLSGMVSQLSTREVLDILEGQEEGRRDVIMVEETMEAASQTEPRSEEEEEGSEAGEPTREELSARLERVIEDSRRLRAENARLVNELERLRDPWRQGNKDMAEKIRKQIASQRGYEGWVELKPREWPSETYSVVREIAGNPIWENNENNLVFIATKEDKLDKGVNRQMRRRFPEVIDLPIDSGFASLSLETKIAIARGEINSRRMIYRIHDEEDEMNTYMNIITLKEKVMEEGQTRVAIPIPEKGWEKIKKMLEHIFWGTDISIMAYTPRKPGKKNGKVEMENKKSATRQVPKKNRNFDAVVVKAEGRSFADLLRGIKEKVDVNKLGVQIMGARSTREGDLLLTMIKEEGKVQALRQEIDKHFGAEKVTTREGGEKSQTIYIKGLEATATTQDIIVAIREVIRNPDLKLEVKSLRPAFANRQNATILVGKKEAEILVGMGALNIGWSTCRIQERVNILKCTKCWGVEHRARECTGTDRSALCLNCVKVGHKVKECSNEAYCPICVKSGHRADSTTCPIYNRAINRGRNWKTSRRRKEPTDPQTSIENREDPTNIGQEDPVLADKRASIETGKENLDARKMDQEQVPDESPDPQGSDTHD